MTEENKNNTINYAIDLGTSDSLIACTQEDKITVIKNHNTGKNYTPSVIAVDEEKIIIGQEAQKKLILEPENATSEFKLNMGFPIKFHFQKTGKSMLPEQLSAEIIKDLRKSAYIQQHEKVEHAVITVPANSNPLKTRATLKAAQLAGLRSTHLILEPIAAAIAYGLQTTQKTRKAWLIYDLGGGTFDASIVKANGEEIEQLATTGADNLGGKIFDWKIVELFQKKIREDKKIKNLEKDNPQHSKIFHRLKQEAEKAKIDLNTKEKTTITIKNLINDYTFNYTLTKKTLEKIMKPFLENTKNICDNLLEEAKLEQKDIEKIILVGGSTQSTTLRKYLKKQYKIPLEYTINPLTVVVQGAAIYAGTITKPQSTPKPDTFSLILNYEKISPKDTFTLKGRIYSLDEGYTYLGHHIQIENTQKTKKIPVEIDGTFKTTLKAPNKINQYKIRLYNEENKTMQMDDNSPNNIKYTKSIKPGKNKIPQTIRIGLNNQKTKILAKKGKQLRYTNKISVHTTQTIKQDTKNHIKIPVYAGENENTENNILIGKIHIKKENINKPLPKNSQIDIHIEIDNINEIKLIIHIPYTKQTLTNNFTYTPTKITYPELQEKYEKTKQKIHQYKQYTQYPQINQILEKHEKQKKQEYLEILMKLSQKDQTVINTTMDYLNNINTDIEKIEKIIENQNLQKQIENKIKILENKPQKNITEQEKLDKIIRKYKQIKEEKPQKLKQLYHEIIKDYTKQYKEEVITQCFHNLRIEGTYTKNMEYSEKLIEKGLENIKKENYKELYKITRKLYEIDERNEKEENISDVY